MVSTQQGCTHRTSQQRFTPCEPRCSLEVKLTCTCIAVVRLQSTPNPIIPVQANRELRSCSEERRHLSQQLSDTDVKLKALQQSIEGLKSDLQDQQRMCRNSDEESKAECGKKMQDLDAQVQAATQELKLSRDRVSGLTADLQTSDRIKSDLQEQSNQCETKAKQEQTLYQQNITELESQLKRAEDAIKKSAKDVSALSAAREQVVQLRTDLHEQRTQCKTDMLQMREEYASELELLQKKLDAGEAVQGQVAQLRTDLHEERTQCKTESLRIRKECANEIEMLQQKHASVAGDKESLSTELQTCQSTLGEESEVRKQAEAKAALHETLQNKLSSDLKVQEQELAKRSDGMKARNVKSTCTAQIQDTALTMFLHVLIPCQVITTIPVIWSPQ